ncbi:MAG: hypothetical protein LC768_05195 [Acidobacteria bacterium]|nr:hypothetical protein [Acidobacteriota bacterium]
MPPSSFRSGHHLSAKHVIGAERSKPRPLNSVVFAEWELLMVKIRNSAKTPKIVVGTETASDARLTDRS